MQGHAFQGRMANKGLGFRVANRNVMDHQHKMNSLPTPTKTCFKVGNS